MRLISFRFSRIKRTTALAAVAALALPALAHANTPVPAQMPAMIRSGKKLVQSTVTLPDLTSTTAFAGKYFTVVDGESNTPIPFNADPKLMLQAATVYYAFSQSRTYFVSALKNIIPTLDPNQQNYLNQPMLIRLNMEHPFSSTLHYDESSTLANGAVTIPPSGIFRDDSVAPWGVETWFFVAKKVPAMHPGAAVSATLNNPDYKLTIFENLAAQDSTLAAENVESNTFSPTVVAENLAISLGLSEVLPSVAAFAVNLVPESLYLNAAMVPEIAANEYAHYALSPWLGLERRFHVGEGYAHFFAAQITGLIELQDNAGKFSSGYAPIQGNSKQMYSYAQEVGAFAAMSSFTFSVLEDLNHGLGADGVPVIVDALGQGLSPSSNLNTDFTNAIFAAIDDITPSPGRDGLTDTLEAHLIFAKRGF